MQWATENMFSVWAWPSHVASASHLFFPIILGGAFWQTMAYLHLKKKTYIGIYENSSGANKAS